VSIQGYETTQKGVDVEHGEILHVYKRQCIAIGSSLDYTLSLEGKYGHATAMPRVSEDVRLRDESGKADVVVKAVGCAQSSCPALRGERSVALTL